MYIFVDFFKLYIFVSMAKDLFLCALHWPYGVSLKSSCDELATCLGHINLWLMERIPSL